MAIFESGLNFAIIRIEIIDNDFVEGDVHFSVLLTSAKILSAIEQGDVSSPAQNLGLYIPIFTDEFNNCLS